jgi:hypothetical protein
MRQSQWLSHIPFYNYTVFTHHLPILFLVRFCGCRNIPPLPQAHRCRSGLPLRNESLSNSNWPSFIRWMNCHVMSQIAGAAFCRKLHCVSVIHRQWPIQNVSSHQCIICYIQNWSSTLGLEPIQPLLAARCECVRCICYVHALVPD